MCLRCQNNLNTLGSLIWKGGNLADVIFLPEAKNKMAPLSFHVGKVAELAEEYFFNAGSRAAFSTNLSIFLGLPTETRRLHREGTERNADPYFVIDIIVCPACELLDTVFFMPVSILDLYAA